MPEGPSIVILKEAAQSFAGQKVLRVDGNTKKVDFARLVYARITDFKSWGKHFLMCFLGFAAWLKIVVKVVVKDRLK